MNLKLAHSTSNSRRRQNEVINSVQDGTSAKQHESKIIMNKQIKNSWPTFFLILVWPGRTTVRPALDARVLKTFIATEGIC